MAITFPASPSDGDVFTNSTTGVKYIYNATDGVWKTHVWPTNTDYLQLSGGTLTGDLSLGTNDLTAQDINSTTLTTTGGVTVGNGLTVSDGNVVMASGHGIDFSADAHAAGMTSELLDDYEEGTWTPVDSNGDQFTVGKTATYTKVGRVVYLAFDITGNASASGFAVYGFPFGALNAVSEGGNFCFYPGYTAGINQDVFGHTGPDNVTLFVGTANETVQNGDRLIMSGWYFTND